MRLLRLDLERFGVFRGAKLELTTAGEPRRPCIVHGPNEAGKTTILEAIRCLLFGFPERAGRFAIGFEQSELAVGALLEFANGKQVEVLRTKGRKATLTGRVLDGGDEVDDDWLRVKLARPNRMLFENVFGFSLDTLARGAASLEQDEIEAALYGAGFGGTVRPQRLLDALAEERGQIFTEKGKSQRVVVHLRKLDELRTQLRQATTPAAEWRQLSQQRDELDRAAEAHRETVRALAAGRAQVRARLDGLEPHRELRLAEAELAALGDTPVLPSHATREHERALQARDRLAEQRDELDRAVHALERDLAELHVDTAVVAAAAEIERLYRGLEAYRAASDELGPAVARADESARRAAARLAATRPTWDFARLRAWTVDAAAATDFERAVARHESLARESQRLRDETISREASRRAAAAALSEDDLAPGATDVAAGLARWLGDWSGHLARRSRLTALDAELEAHRRRATQLRRQLDPPLSAPDADVESLPAPRAEEVERFVLEQAALAHRRARVDEQLARGDDDLATIDAELAELAAQGPAPTEDELREARARRERGWRLITRTLAAELVDADARAYDPLRALPRAYEQAVSDADELADAMRKRADAVQRRALLEARRARVQREVDGRAVLRREVEHEANALAARWMAAWDRCGFVPLSADSMRAWLGDLRACLDARARVAELASERDRLADELTRFVADGLALLGLPASASPEDARDEAQRRVDACGARARRRELLRARVESDAGALAVAEERLAGLRDEAARWSTRWSEHLAALGLLAGEQDTLSPAAAERVLQELRGAQEALAAHDEHVARALALRTTVAEFERASEALRVEARLPPGDAATTVGRAHEALRAARDAERLGEERRRNLAANRRRRDEVSAALVEHDAALAAARAALGVEDEAAHAALLARVDRAAAAREVIDRSLRALRRGCPPDGLDVHLAALDAAEPEGLRLELDRLDREALRLEGETSSLHGALGELRHRFKAIDGSSAAAEREAEAASVRAALRDDVDRWTVLTLAEEILKASIRRFEREHQPELLESASRLLADMTGGRWTRIERRLGGSLRLERARGEPVGPDVLSTGTREQLYLALRLAYVEHYGRRAEPLPLVLDDVLVNFDAARAAATLGALARFSTSAQVVLFTCQASLVDLARASGIPCTHLALPAR